VPPREAIPASRSLRRAVAGAGVASAALWVAGLTARVVASDGAGPLWGGGPLSVLRGIAALLLPFVLIPSVIRVLAHPSAVAMPVNTVRTTMAGVTGTLGCLLVIAPAMLVGRLLTLGGPDDVATGPLGWLPVVPVLAAAAAALATVRLLRLARIGYARCAPRAPSGWDADAARPDLLDDLTTLIARALPGSGPARAGAWLNRGLDSWSWSPRRHRTAFVVSTAGPSGIAVTVWCSAVRGPWQDLVTPVALAALSAALVAAGLVAAITWLGLLRPQPAAR
jgi:hypothetical protein